MYEKKASRAHPVLAVFVIDESGSMGDCLPGSSDKKCTWTERYAGILFKDLLERCTSVNGDSVTVKSRYHILVIRYGGRAEVWGDGIMDIEAAIERYSKANNSLGLRGGLGGTNAEAAFQLAFDYLKDAVKQEKFRDSFPAMLFHLTDGMSHTDATALAERIKQLQTQDGNVLIANAYIGTKTNLSYQGPEDFPGYLDASEAGPSDDNIRLFNMSSEVPASIRADLKERQIFPQLREGSRLFFDVRTKQQLKHAIQVVGSIAPGDRTER